LVGGDELSPSRTGLPDQPTGVDDPRLRGFFGLLPGQGRTWANRDRTSQYVVIPQAAHNAQQENPTFFNCVLLEFLARGELYSEQNEEIEYAQTRQPGQ
jgi:hypothetical protein